jgi:hypothetical protein
MRRRKLKRYVLALSLLGTALIFGCSGDKSTGSDGNGVSVTLASSYHTAYVSTGVAVTGNYVLVACYDTNLTTLQGSMVVVNVANPSSPILAAQIDTLLWMPSIAVSGHYAYVSGVSDGGSGALLIYDVATPTSPVVAGRYTLPSMEITCLAVDGMHAYVCGILGYSPGLHIVDVSDPAAPEPAGVYGGLQFPNNVVVAGQYVYIADALGGLKIIDVSNTNSPTLVGSYVTDGQQANWVAVAGDYAYVGYLTYTGGPTTTGLLILNVADHSTPSLAGNLNIADYPSTVSVVGTDAYVAGSQGIWVADITNPAAPKLTGLCQVSMTPRGAAAIPARIYVADMKVGLRVFTVSGE